MEPISSVMSASSIQMDYMKLLITQMQNQNPLEPMNNEQMASQLAQFSQLQQLESINTNSRLTNANFGQILNSFNRSYATSLIGKEVTFYFDDEETGAFIKKVGTVTETYSNPETGENLLGVTVADDGDYTLSLDAVKLVKNSESIE
jgi:flagellar hook assembly protein FlgD